MAELERVVARHGVVWLRSRLLADGGVAHGFSTRVGGVSGGAFASLNLAGARSTGGEDDPAALVENRRRFLEAVGLDDRSVATVRQVHGAEVIAANACVDGSGPSDGHGGGADAIVADGDGAVACMIRVADCVPILVADPTCNVVAAIHAGWRGIVAGVVGATLESLRARGAGRGIVAAIGPCASVERFEVGEEVATEFERVGRGDAVVRRAGWPRPHLDLFAAVRAQLRAHGVEFASIDGMPTCTMSDQANFFSHRRDGGVTGRMAAVIAPRDGRPA